MNYLALIIAGMLIFSATASSINTSFEKSKAQTAEIQYQSGLK